MRRGMNLGFNTANWGNSTHLPASSARRGLRQRAGKMSRRSLALGAGAGLAVAIAVRNTGPGATTSRGRPTGIYKY